MNPSAFAYERAESVQEAIALLSQHGEGAKLIAGGHSLLPIMKLRLAEPERLIDIGRIDALQGRAAGRKRDRHRRPDDASAGRHRRADSLPGSAAGGDRSRWSATAKSAIAARSAARSLMPTPPPTIQPPFWPSTPRSWPRVLDGERRIPARDFFVDFLTTALEPTEVLREIRIANPGQAYGWSYQKLANQASGYAIVGVAALLALDADGNVADVRVGVTGAAPVAWRASATEDALRGKNLDRADGCLRGGTGRRRRGVPRRPARLGRVPAASRTRPDAPCHPGSFRASRSIGIESPPRPTHGSFAVGAAACRAPMPQQTRQRSRIPLPTVSAATINTTAAARGRVGRGSSRRDCWRPALPGRAGSL